MHKYKITEVKVMDGWYYKKDIITCMWEFTCNFGATRPAFKLVK